MKTKVGKSNESNCYKYVSCGKEKDQRHSEKINFNFREQIEQRDQTIIKGKH